MVTLDLSAEEIAILVDVLESDLSDLRMEIADTDRQEFREALKARKAAILRALAQLGTGAVSAKDS